MSTFLAFVILDEAEFVPVLNLVGFETRSLPFSYYNVKMSE
jgi:hypothetical protein